MDRKPVIVALDNASAADALELAARLGAQACRVKVGKELFTRAGPRLVETLVARGFDVFLDLKFHDIPNTVAGACRAAAELGCWMINVHASGGARMLAAARSSLEEYAPRPLLIGVTVLTSLDEEALHEVGVAGALDQQVSRLARLAASCGLDGVVCSPRELPRLRAECAPAFKLVTPGIRPPGSAAGDQVRTAEPVQARDAGADYLVIGRPITQAADPAEALRSIAAQLATEGRATDNAG